MDDFYSILPATRVPVAELPNATAQQKAPDFPMDLSRKGCLVLFLRHLGCPFAEKAFRQLRFVGEAYGKQLNYYAVSHASKADTDEWVEALGGRGNITLVIDTTRELYGKWGLPLTGVAHTFGLTSLSQVVSLAWNEGIYNRATKGTRWQSSGFFGIKDGNVVFAKKADTANDIPNLGQIAEALTSKSI